MCLCLATCGQIVNRYHEQSEHVLLSLVVLQKSKLFLFSFSFWEETPLLPRKVTEVFRSSE